MTHILGQLSEQFESGGRGPGAVSDGKNDPGGVSYGIWQMSSKAGIVQDFVKNEGAHWPELQRPEAGSPAFSVEWKLVAKREPGAFEAAQRAYIERTHYRPIVDAVHKATGLDLDAQCDAVRDATWSCAVQHGGAARILIAAIYDADRGVKRADTAYQRTLLNAIYADRSAYVRGIADRMTDAGQRVALIGITTNRYPAELAAALAELPDGV